MSPQTVPSVQRVALSKKIEYPGSVTAITALLADPEIDPSGSDMFGYTALHKIASWNQPELLELLLPKLLPADISQPGK